MLISEMALSYSTGPFTRISFEETQSEFKETKKVLFNSPAQFPRTAAGPGLTQEREPEPDYWLRMVRSRPVLANTVHW